MSLMFHSVAVINPSEFESRNTVEQAKSLGKQVILSNIKILKQKPDKAKYFKVHDCQLCQL